MRRHHLYQAMMVGLAVLLGLLVINLHSVGGIDTYVTSFIHQLPASLLGLMKWASEVGTSGYIIEAAVLWALIELVVFRSRTRSLVSVASLLSLPLFDLLKTTAQRARPVTDFVKQSGLHDYSFPSGHASGSAAVYGMVGYLIYLRLPKPWKYVWLPFPILLIVLIGVSRVYLGAHFPTDVLGGWLVGALVILVVVFVSEKLEERYKKVLQDTKKPRS